MRLAYSSVLHDDLVSLAVQCRGGGGHAAKTCWQSAQRGSKRPVYSLDQTTVSSSQGYRKPVGSGLYR